MAIKSSRLLTTSFSSLAMFHLSFFTTAKKISLLGLALMALVIIMIMMAMMTMMMIITVQISLLGVAFGLLASFLISSGEKGRIVSGENWILDTSKIYTWGQSSKSFHNMTTSSIFVCDIRTETTSYTARKSVLHIKPSPPGCLQIFEAPHFLKVFWPTNWETWPTAWMGWWPGVLVAGLYPRPDQWYWTFSKFFHH